MTVLARDEISRRLYSPDPEQQVFLPGTWDIECLRGGAYDLRVAPDFLILPNGSRFWPDAPDPANRASFASFELKPGEVAFVSSAERFCLPWDLAANIAPKFRLALSGLLVMGGMLVDPGYGRLCPGDSDRTVPDPGPGQRLHFQLVNLGVKSLTVVPEETCVAAVQFLELKGDARSRFEGPGGERIEEVGAPSQDNLLRDLFHPHAHEPLPQLAFFVRTAGMNESIRSLERGIEQNELKLEVSERANDRVLVYGVLVILITIFGASLAAIISAI